MRDSASGAPAIIGPVSPSVMGSPPIHFDSGRVEIRLESSQDNPAAGARFAVQGTIINRQARPVWIVGERTTLLPPPEISGGGRELSMPANLPSLQSEPTGEVVRIDPGTSYDVIWYLGPTGASDRRFEASFWDAFRFRPGEYRFTAQVHTWNMAPRLEAGRVVNISDSQIARGETRIAIDLPIRILVLGAVLGGLAAFSIPLVGMFKAGQRPAVGWLAFIGVGGGGAILAAAIGTVLLSRLGQMDAFISLRINDCGARWPQDSFWSGWGCGELWSPLARRTDATPVGERVE